MISIIQINKKGLPPSLIDNGKHGSRFIGSTF